MFGAGVNGIGQSPTSHRIKLYKLLPRQHHCARRYERGTFLCFGNRLWM